MKALLTCGLITIFETGLAVAQIGSINSYTLMPRVFNDIPTANGTYINSYPAYPGGPGFVSFSEQNVTSATGFANRDVWYFSNNGGTSPYLFQNGDYFHTSMNVTIVGNTSGIDLEAGYLFSNPSGGFGGDLQLLMNVNNGVVVQFGGPSYYPFSPSAGGYPGAGGGVPNYLPGLTYNLSMSYLPDPLTGRNAFQYWVNGQQAASSPGNPYFDLAPGASIGSAGDFLGGYFQIQRSTAAGNNGAVIFGDITITSVPEPSFLALLSFGGLAMALRRRS
ncbi:MAG TPA: PEP-CTERM sorting domain-containing protein [Verrucomicrobiae bacterium]|nr:PEP-CTERM sorting domain-containing protein [Verrucomicrobiae bacterium]